MNLIQYILISTTCLSISYLAYRLFLRKYTNFSYLRLFLIWSLITSLILPLLSVSIDYTSLFGKEKMTTISLPAISEKNMAIIADPAEDGFFSAYSDLFLKLYLAISSLLILRILIQLVRMLFLYLVSNRRRNGRNMVLYSGYIKSPSSFFRLIFIPDNLFDNEEGENIITHESIHASQYHSFDNLLIELVAAVMWFNPLVWMMKGSLHLVHEYLADEGALSTGIDRLRYQALLINQVTEERLICLSSSFNHSLIKKRMIMMTKIKNNRQNKLKILTLIPLSAVLFLMVALLNGLFPQDVQAAIPAPEAFNQFDPLSSEEPLIQDDTTKKKTYHIRIVSKDKEATSEETSGITVSGDVTISGDLPDSLIYVVDGVHVKDINSICPDSIKSINVIKSDNVMIIRTKKAEGENPGKYVYIKQGGGIPSDAIIYIDGDKSTIEALKNLDPEQIVTINIKKSGDSGDVFEITTKDKN